MIYKLLNLIFKTNKMEKKMKKLTFGEAIEALKSKKRVARKGWNGKNVFLVYVEGEHYQLNTIAENNLVGDKQLPWIGIKTADNCFVPWLASQTDILSEDWVILD